MKKAETTIDRTNGGKGRINAIRAYVSGKLCRTVLMFKDEKITYKRPS